MRHLLLGSPITVIMRYDVEMDAYDPDGGILLHSSSCYQSVQHTGMQAMRVSLS
jgi:hypothetical protein